jgi:DNA modification methylase
MRTGRRCVLIEREEKYCEIIANRLEHWQDESKAKPKRKKAAKVMGQMEFEF